MILSDRSIREALADGRIGIDPVDDSFIQPSSVDLTVDRFFRVFRNHTTPIIDVKQNLEELTELVEIPDDGVFVLHPGEFVLGATAERIRLPDDLVARLEGKSSLGRLGLLIHSSLPASEPVIFLDEGGLRPVPIGDIVTKQMPGRVVSFHPETFAVGYHDVTGWYEGPADRIYEVELASGRRVRVTAGHNLFTVNGDGELAKVRTGELRPGQRVAVPGRIPDPTDAASALVLTDLAPEPAFPVLTCSGPTIAEAFEQRPDEIGSALRRAGYRHVSYYRDRGRLPLSLAHQIPGLVEALGGSDRIGVRGGRNELPAVVEINDELAWLLGLYVAEGHRRPGQVTISNTDQEILDRAELVFASLRLPVCRSAGAITCTSAVASRWLGWLGTGEGAATKRVPSVAYAWPTPLVESFLEGFIDGDGSREQTRVSLWTCSDDLVADFLVLLARLGRRAGASWRDKGVSGLWQVSIPHREHKLSRLTEDNLNWDVVVAVRDTGASEPIYDLEVRPDGCKVENFLAGAGGVFVSNTAGFIDAGFDGHLTLELSNVATLPITLYPGMKIGQISFLEMTTEADAPYGSKTIGSKYQGQRGPTASRYWENFDRPAG